MWQRKMPEDKRCHRHILASFRPTGKERYRNAADKGAIQVIAGHRGWRGADYFRHIDRLQVGDTFYIHVLGDTLAYKVDAINTVLPTDTSLLQIEDGEDQVTLVTCTPFGINTHRLLVRGHRIPYTPEQATTAAAEKPATSSWTRHYLTGLGIGLGAVAVIGGAYFLVRRYRHA